MTINRRPPRAEQQDTNAFVERATEQDTAKLQCWIPADLHLWLKHAAADRHTNMTALVVESLENYRREREGCELRSPRQLETETS